MNLDTLLDRLGEILVRDLKRKRYYKLEGLEEASFILAAVGIAIAKKKAG